MRKILSILTAGLLIIVISCNSNTTEQTTEQATEQTLGQLGLDARDITRITAELDQKGLSVKDTIWVEPDEYLLGLYKLNQLTEEDMKQVKELGLIKISVADYFSKQGATEFGGELSVDYRASIEEIKDHVLKSAAFAYNEHTKESLAHHQSLEIAKSLRLKGMGPIYKHALINWRECLVGLKTLSFISEHEIVKANLEKVTIQIGEISHYLKLNDVLGVEIHYKASLEEIKKLLFID